MKSRSLPVWTLVVAFGAVWSLPDASTAHCDGMDGPVVRAARRALATGEVERLLIWVQQEHEEEVRSAFHQALEVGRLGDEAEALAHKYLFETVVRLHRAGEGASYTGLKPAGRDLGPAIPVADRALSSGDPEPLLELILGEVREGISKRFAHTHQASRFSPDDVAAGRAYVHAYVEFIHFVERAHDGATQPADGHFPGEPGGLPVHDE